MSRRITYSDDFYGESDRSIRKLLYNDDDSGERTAGLKKILLNVINNELTPRQKEIIVLYYFKDMDMVEISKLLGVTPQAVSAAMRRGRLTIFRFLQYYLQ